jgi:hypothetical protein
MCPGGCSPVAVALRAGGVGGRAPRRSVCSRGAAEVTTPSSSSGARPPARRICTISSPPSTWTARIVGSALTVSALASSDHGSRIGTRAPWALRATGYDEDEGARRGGGGTDGGRAGRGSGGAGGAKGARRSAPAGEAPGLGDAAWAKGVFGVAGAGTTGGASSGALGAGGGTEASLGREAEATAVGKGGGGGTASEVGSSPSAWDVASWPLASGAWRGSSACSSRRAALASSAARPSSPAVAAASAARRTQTTASVRPPRAHSAAAVDRPQTTSSSSPGRDSGMEMTRSAIRIPVSQPPRAAIILIRSHAAERSRCSVPPPERARRLLDRTSMRPSVEDRCDHGSRRGGPQRSLGLPSKRGSP